ncbi:MAG: conjugative transposon protein TraK [Prevotellaceae bacterium]|jgi:conjugative transposon TraK protein|nr:conjugative transposon protein TraK [Prevotellaceae bacterium]
MVFKSLQNIESAFKAIRWTMLAVVAACTLIAIYAVSSAHQMVAREREKIYVLDKGKSLILALSQDLQQNRPVEARDHVRMFHECFFTLSPDNEAINQNLRRALFLSDKSVYRYYTDLAESGYYKQLMSTNTRQYVFIDSMACDFESYPYSVVTYARQVIVRPSTTTIRHLVTTCELSNAVRSDNNPHGFIIERFNVKNNEDISTQRRR